ncbi:aminotransferase V [Novosphingobium sp. PC22D]|uniref:aminotransferase class V-fold PLP-dependent enzyme n=1 Tax=Novosphingobium sp. PC22D TaxID=1962403 RepID=UPI000BF02BAF|nr:aminotransferase class V-fold PLP-dependent enzyme [Novosphingobium sp. PC22D]PEQ13077.1 aminotransferase V [Novosphingobium sp. PC22D]
MPTPFDVEAFRANFPSIPKLAYLNSGSYGLLSHGVRDAFERYMQARIAVGADWGGWIGELEALRTKMATLLSCDSDEIAITGSASSGLNSLAGALDFRGARNKVVVSNFEFPTSAQIWHAQERVGARVVHVREGREAVIPLAHFEEAIDDETAIVAISQVCYRHGGRIPDDEIRAIAAMAHRHGALLVLDTYQIVGSAPISPRELDVDVCIGGMLKYLLGTAGIGFMYVRKDLIETLVPRATGWFAQTDVDAMDIFKSDPSPTARRFEAGTPPVAPCIASSAGLSLLLDAGIEAISGQVATMTRHAMEALKEAGIPFCNPDADERRGPLVSIPSLDDNALVNRLAERDIITSCRDGKLRAGFHAYNDEGDVARFIEALQAHRDLLDLVPDKKDPQF